MMASILYELYEGPEITSAMLNEAATIFSEHYGVWGPRTQSPGARVRMSASRLQKTCLPSHALEQCAYVRATLDGTLISNAFACYWQAGCGSTCWITQLVVHRDYRSRGISKELLTRLRRPEIEIYGILSSHAHACMAAVRAFSGNIHDVDLDFIKLNAERTLATSPVTYVREARPHGTLHDNAIDGAVSTADTGFFVDHGEPDRALASVRAGGVDWPFGELPEGHEYLVILKPACTKLDNI